jgi:16S rRNA (cytidine1402-2'-O)-methyltransferase
MPFGTLYVVATPVGNLEDITARAVRILKEADIIAAEDTRHSIKLLNHFGISKPLLSYWSENEKVKTGELIEKLLSGADVALISDAGTPGISDPGAVLIRKAIEERIHVIPVPGPSALTAALSVSGLPAEEFTFIGFLPAKEAQRRKKLTEIAHETRTLIFYEAPHRLVQMLDDTLAILGDRHSCVAKEISKLHEQIFRGGLSSVIEQLSNTKIAGEYVINVAGFTPTEGSIEEALSEMFALMKKGLGRKEASRKVADRYGIGKNELYDSSLEQPE